MWEKPEDLVGRADVDKAVAQAPDQLATQTNNANSSTTSKDEKQKPIQTENNTDQTTPTAKRSESESSGENDDVPNKKLKLTDNNAAAVNATNLTKPATEKKNDIGKEAAIEAEVRAARERALVPLETRVNSFKEMLKEKDVC